MAWSKALSCVSMSKSLYQINTLSSIMLPTDEYDHDM